MEILVSKGKVVLDHPREISYNMNMTDPFDEEVYILQVRNGQQGTLLERLGDLPFRGRVSVIYPSTFDYVDVPYIFVSGEYYSDVEMLAHSHPAVIRILSHRHVTWEIDEETGRSVREIWYEPAKVSFMEALDFLERVASLSSSSFAPGHRVYVDALGMECLISKMDRERGWVIVEGKILGSVSPLKVSYKVWERWRREGKIHLQRGG